MNSEPQKKHTPHILIIADGRSPTSRSWIANVQALNFRTSLVSTYPCPRPPGMEHFSILPVAFSRFSGGSSGSRTSENPHGPGPLRRVVRRFAPLLQALRHRLGPLTVYRYAKPYQKLLKICQPDLIHALRIPFEGMLGSFTPPGAPFLAAIWGNDLTLHAAASPLMRRLTHRCLSRADGLTADTHRDAHLARSWGLAPEAPTLVLPGSGGLDLAAVQAARAQDPDGLNLPQDGPWVINPRGLRPGSIHQETFFAAVPRVLAQRPETIFLCPGLANRAVVQTWLERYGGTQRVFLLPKLPQSLLWNLFHRAEIFISPSSHDGTPNSLLEALACGCFPVVGDIPSLQEWITQGENGYLVNPQDPNALAEAILAALDAEDLRRRAAEQNLAAIRERAAQQATRPTIEAFYRTFLTANGWTAFDE